MQSHPTAPDERRQQYEAYLASPEWQAKRLEALERAEHRCQVCNTTKRLDVHHRTYTNFKNERPADLTVLCRRCHELFHEKRWRRSEVAEVTSVHAMRPPKNRDWRTHAAAAVERVIEAQRPGYVLTTKEIAKKAGLTPNVASGGLSRLRRQGKVQRVAKKMWCKPAQWTRSKRPPATRHRSDTRGQVRKADLGAWAPVLSSQLKTEASRREAEQARADAQRESHHQRMEAAKRERPAVPEIKPWDKHSALSQQAVRARSRKKKRAA